MAHSLGFSGLLRKGGRRSPHELRGVEAVVLPKITAPLPAFLVPFNHRWKHLTGLHLAYRDFGTPGPVDILLGADVFSHILLYSQRSGPSRTPSALETRFGCGFYVVKRTPSIHDSQWIPISHPSHDSRIPTSCGICLYKGPWKRIQCFGGVVITSRPQRWKCITGTMQPAPLTPPRSTSTSLTVRPCGPRPVECLSICGISGLLMYTCTGISSYGYYWASRLILMYYLYFTGH